MNHLHLAPGLTLPLDAVTQKLAFLGRTGSGKTYAAGKLAEEMLDAGAQIVALDPVGVWWGLRLGADGKSAGISIPVFGGLHGDVPLEATGGRLLADLIVDRGISAVLDVSQFESDAAKARFARDFAERFFFRKKASPSAVHLFLEECQEFLPQNPSRDEPQMLHAFTRLYKLGRNFGVGGSLISQRPQEVNKKALNMTECLFAFQMTGPHERKTVESWIEDKGLDIDIVGDLPKLQVGHAHVWSPAWLEISKTVAIASKRTFNASSTPEVGKRAQARELAPIDLEQIRKQMSDTIERAKADDPKELRRRIAQLERERSAKPTAIVTEAPARIVEKPVFLEVDRHALGSLLNQVSKLGDRVGELQSRIDARLRLTEPHKLTMPPPTALARPVSRPPKPTNGHDHGLGNTGARRMLVALAQNPDGLTATKLSILTGISRGGGTWRTYLGQLRGSRYLEGDASRFAITQSGLAAIGDWDPLPTGAALISYWRGGLGDTGARRIFDALVDAYPRALSPALCAERTGMALEGGTWRTYLGKLRGLGLVEGRGELRASEDLFA